MTFLHDFVDGLLCLDLQELGDHDTATIRRILHAHVDSLKGFNFSTQLEAKALPREPSEEAISAAYTVLTHILDPDGTRIPIGNEWAKITEALRDAYVVDAQHGSPASPPPSTQGDAQ
jgi:hypothetical protein